MEAIIPRLKITSLADRGCHTSIKSLRQDLRVLMSIKVAADP